MVAVPTSLPDASLMEMTFFTDMFCAPARRATLKIAKAVQARSAVLQDIACCCTTVQGSNLLNCGIYQRELPRGYLLCCRVCMWGQSTS